MPLSISPIIPKASAIDILKNEDQPSLPWTFRVPFEGQTKHENEPTKHENGITSLTQAVFECRHAFNNSFVDHFKGENIIKFSASARNWLTLTFDHAKQGLKQDFHSISMTIEY